ncbi:MAG: PQQ-dependent sugar dehydrogenase, partial [Bacteroidota bacterium]
MTRPLLLAPLAFALLAAPACSQTLPGSQADQVMADRGVVTVSDVVGGLDHPWGMAFLPDGRLLVTERDAGTLRIVGTDGTLSDPVGGVPEVSTRGQGGLLDVALDPEFEDNGFVYLAYARPSAVAERESGP